MHTVLWKEYLKLCSSIFYFVICVTTSALKSVVHNTALFCILPWFTIWYVHQALCVTVCFMHHIVCVAICYTHYAALPSDICITTLCCQLLYTSHCLCCHLLYTLCCVAIWYTHHSIVLPTIIHITKLVLLSVAIRIMLHCHLIYASQHCVANHYTHHNICVAICYTHYVVLLSALCTTLLFVTICYTHTIFCVSICCYYTLCCVITWFVRLILLHHRLFYGSPLCYLLLPSDTRVTLSCVSTLYMHHSVFSYYLWYATHH
jgi:hypothetical protein